MASISVELATLPFAESRQVLVGDDSKNRRQGGDQHVSARVGLLSRQALLDASGVVVPYFTQPETRLLAWLFVLFSLGSCVAGNLLYACWISTKSHLQDSLVAKEADEVWRCFWAFFKIIAGWVVSVAFKQSCMGALKLEWRRFATQSLLKSYIRGDTQAYYRLPFRYDDQVDNPDQRIGEDVREFVNNFVELSFGFVEAFVAGIVFVPMLWSASPIICVVLLCFAPLLTLIHLGFFGTRLAYWTRQSLKQEATLRFRLIRIRENAESVAFLQGEARELGHCENMFQAVLRTLYRRLFVFIGYSTFKHSTQWFTYLLPLLLLGPQILDGSQNIGVLTSAEGSFSAVLDSLVYIIGNLDQISEVGAEAHRISTLSEAISKDAEMKGSKEIGEEVSLEDSLLKPTDDVLQIQSLWLWPPVAYHLKHDPSMAILTGLSFTLERGETLLISGRSGVGKSSLLRAIAGLWRSGKGRIRRCGTKFIIFQPQNPYMCLGTLREQVLYPFVSGTEGAEIPTDADIVQALSKVNIAHLVERHGLHEQIDFSHALSLGEQQRLSALRLMFQRELQLILLDESTSALDESNEIMLYDFFGNLGSSYISVGHRGTLRKFHTHELHIERARGGEWCTGSKQAIPSGESNNMHQKAAELSFLQVG